MPRAGYAKQTKRRWRMFNFDQNDLTDNSHCLFSKTLSQLKHLRICATKTAGFNMYLGAFDQR
ncbi:MAG: hypothetical protein K2X93_05995 [Candidatus Obscuribacterales bacterium]|nr:hypothetical protein [Candidatus Obscuribacterales bacterium]